MVLRQTTFSFSTPPRFFLIDPTLLIFAVLQVEYLPVGAGYNTRCCLSKPIHNNFSMQKLTFSDIYIFFYFKHAPKVVERCRRSLLWPSNQSEPFIISA